MGLERQIDIKSAYSHKALENAIIVLEELVLATPKTKDFKKVLEALTDTTEDLTGEIND